MIPRLARMMGPTVAVVVVALVTGWIPAQRAQHHASQRVDAAERLVSDLQWELEDLGVISGDEGELQAELAALTARIPDDHHIAEVILTLEALAAATGTTVIDVVPASILGPYEDLRTPLGTNSIVVAVAMRGTFPSLLSLVDGLTHQTRLMTLDGVAIGIDETTDGLIIDLEIRVFTTREMIVADDGFADDELFDEEDSE